MTDMPDAEVFYVPNFIDKRVAQEWYNELLMLDSCKYLPITIFEFAHAQLWLGYTPTLKVYGREVTQSRKMASP
jgi:hypothetical protein